VTIVSMITIFFSGILRVFSATWLIGLWIVETIYGGCPLTFEENDLRKKGGEKVDNTKFMPRFIEKYFHLKLPDWLAELWITLFFIISLIILIRIFF